MKATFRRGQSNEGMKEYEEACKDFAQCGKLDPSMTKSCDKEIAKYAPELSRICPSNVDQVLEQEEEAGREPS